MMHGKTNWRSKSSKMDGAKEAIKAVVQDSTLTSGAYFGFGHWNSGIDGVFGKGNGVDFSGAECHRGQFCNIMEVGMVLTLREQV